MIILSGRSCHQGRAGYTAYRRRQAVTQLFSF